MVLFPRVLRLNCKQRPVLLVKLASGIFLAASVARAGSGQSVLRDLSGTVQDGHHEPLRGAVVYLENESDHNVVTYITDRTGHFSFKRLRGDVDYDVWAVVRGEASKKKTLSQFDTHPNPTIAITIRPE